MNRLVDITTYQFAPGLKLQASGFMLIGDDEKLEACGLKLVAHNATIVTSKSNFNHSISK